MFAYFCLAVKSLGIAGDQRLAFPAILSQGSRRTREKHRPLLSSQREDCAGSPAEPALPG
ncbi:hypothetical protein [Synechococcus sp. H55.10]|uniref:hypothetical protein n=1 Tax=Synechococcus sp. H55.10 TaxID=2964503 RepID=UPI0039C705A6